MFRCQIGLLHWMEAGVVLTMAVAGGCSSSQGDRPELTQVHGTVTFNGQPLDAAMVRFNPVAPGQRSSLGVTDKEGRYKLTYLRDIKGASLGQHKVQITTASETTKERLPDKYHRNTTLTVEVQPDKRQYDFDLE